MLETMRHHCSEFIRKLYRILQRFDVLQAVIYRCNFTRSIIRRSRNFPMRMYSRDVGHDDASSDTKLAAKPSRTVIILFRHNLRLHDNTVLHTAVDIISTDLARDASQSEDTKVRLIQLLKADSRQMPNTTSAASPSPIARLLPDARLPLLGKPRILAQ